MNILNKKFPTLIAIILLMVGVIVTSILVQKRVIIFQQAAPSDAPQNLMITNISDQSYSVIYTTDASVIGTISVTGSDGKSQVVLDDRDQQSGTPKSYNIHSITAKNLSPNATYTFTILSGSTTFLNSDKPFSLTTPDTLSANPSTQIPLSGKILLSDGSMPDEALVVVTSDNGQFLSTLQNAAGLYILPLNTMRTKDLKSYISFSQNTKFQIIALNQNSTSHVIVGISGISPLPPITLSQDYDFTFQTTPLASGAANVNFPSLSFSANTINATPQIITPQNNQSFTDQQPQFKGTAQPNTSVTISIHSDTTSTSVTTDSSGNWTYRPTSPLSVGQHTITITTLDQYGILHTITQNFVVFAQGSQVNQSATPSSTLVPPTPSPTPSLTTIPTLINTPTPTLVPTIASGSSFPMSPKPSIPPTGSNTIAVAGLAGIATTIIGIVIFVITGGISL